MPIRSLALGLLAVQPSGALRNVGRDSYTVYSHMHYTKIITSIIQTHIGTPIIMGIPADQNSSKWTSIGNI